jgi:hypothetical protein
MHLIRRASTSDFATGWMPVVKSDVTRPVGLDHCYGKDALAAVARCSGTRRMRIAANVTEADGRCAGRPSQRWVAGKCGRRSCRCQGRSKFDPVRRSKTDPVMGCAAGCDGGEPVRRAGVASCRGVVNRWGWVSRGMFSSARPRRTSDELNEGAAAFDRSSLGDHRPIRG